MQTKTIRYLLDSSLVNYKIYFEKMFPTNINQLLQCYPISNDIFQNFLNFSNPKQWTISNFQISEKSWQISARDSHYACESAPYRIFCTANCLYKIISILNKVNAALTSVHTAKLNDIFSKYVNQQNCRSFQCAQCAMLQLIINYLGMTDIWGCAQRDVGNISEEKLSIVNRRLIQCKVYDCRRYPICIW